MAEPARPHYDPRPHYPLVGGQVSVGFGSLVARLAGRASGLAIDGPAALDWESLVAGLVNALEGAGLAARIVDVRERLPPWAEIEVRTDGGRLRGDPDFARLCGLELAEVLGGRPPVPEGEADLPILFGPGAALAPHDVLWYVGLPKQAAAEAVARGAPNLGQPAGGRGDLRRLMFVDWPVEDRHAGRLVPRIDCYLDGSDPGKLRWVEGETLRRTLERLAHSPFRTRPVFLPGAWGGQWLKEVLGVPGPAPNLAWSYELISPESGILLGEADDPPLEVGFHLLMAVAGEDVVGAEVAARFGSSFPIRFDYLDTYRGGHLSVHCHPRPSYMRDTFGWPYTQHETYYVMETSPGARIFLGLREGADLDAFAREAQRAVEQGTPFDIERYVATVPARRHRLYLIPAGTPHAASAGNAVLEISATPYLYSLRFYDWLRADLAGALRPIHLRHAFANLAPSERPAGLVPRPRLVRRGPGVAEWLLGRHPELFFAVHRLDFEGEAEEDTAGRFHVLNLVEGEAMEILTSSGDRHPLAYAETVVVPAAVGRYRLHSAGRPCKVVKALVVG